MTARQKRNYWPYGITKQQVAEREMDGLCLARTNIHKTFILLARTL